MNVKKYVDGKIDDLRIDLKKDDDVLIQVSTIKKDLKEMFRNINSKVEDKFVLKELYETTVKDSKDKFDELQGKLSKQSFVTKTNLLKGKVNPGTEEYIITKYNEQIEEDGSNIQKIIELANEEMKFTRLIPGLPNQNPKVLEEVKTKTDGKVDEEEKLDDETQKALDNVFDDK